MPLRSLVLWMIVILSAACGDSRDPVAVSLPELPRECNGSSNLCAKRYTEILFLTTHNAMSNADDFWVAPNQDHTITRQLEDGIRALSLDFHPNSANEDEPLLCHGACAGGSKLLGVEFGNIRMFLEDHPNEVLTISYEANQVSDESVAALMKRTGLAGYAYSQATDAVWPTLGEMIDRNQRLVVFSQDGAGIPGLILREWDHSWDTPYEATDVGDFACNVGRGKASAPIFQINHFLTAPVAGRALAELANTYEVLSEHVQRCWREAGQMPNFLWVDWYATGEAQRVVDEVNAGVIVR